MFGPHYCSVSSSIGSQELSGQERPTIEGIVLEKRRSSRYQQQRLSDLDFADDIALIEVEFLASPGKTMCQMK